MTPANGTTNYDKTCTLLHASNAHNVEARIAEKPKSTPVPKGQLAAFCVIRLVEPIAFTQLIPYVNEFMNDLHLTDDPSKMGFYSGLVVHVIGRRSVLFFGIIGLVITTLMFGWSKSLATGGLFSGNIAVIHSVLGYITDSANQMDINVDHAYIHRPLIGGTFSHPASKYPKIFEYQFLKDYPYFLPCFIAFVIAIIIGVFLGFLFLEE
ncbi:hypothetical protein EDD22DRAFT_782666, partial [Suillus occidentalis]